jgi:hypothetical protein
MRTSRVWFGLALVMGVVAFFVIRHTTTNLDHISAGQGQQSPCDTLVSDDLAATPRLARQIGGQTAPMARLARRDEDPT